jgi:hypothetical protein
MDFVTCTIFNKHKRGDKIKMWWDEKSYNGHESYVEKLANFQSENQEAVYYLQDKRSECRPTDWI